MAFHLILQFNPTKNTFKCLEACLPYIDYDHIVIKALFITTCSNPKYRTVFKFVFCHISAYIPTHFSVYPGSFQPISRLISTYIPTHFSIYSGSFQPISRLISAYILTHFSVYHYSFQRISGLISAYILTHFSVYPDSFQHIS